MQKKAIKASLLGLLLFVLSVEFTEIANFIYMLPFALPFFLFLASSESELNDEDLGYSVPFIFGLMSDLAIFKSVSILCIIFPSLTYVIKYGVKELKLHKEPIFITLILFYAITVYMLQSPLWDSILVLGYTFLSWKLFSIICSKILSKRENGKTR